MFDYKKAINQGMREAIRQIMIQIKNVGIKDGEIYIKFKLEPFHFNQIAVLVPDYADFFTIEISPDSYKNLEIFENFFTVDIMLEALEIKSNDKTVNVKVNFESIVHFIDTNQNVSIEIEEEGEEDQQDVKLYGQKTSKRKIN